MPIPAPIPGPAGPPGTAGLPTTPADALLDAASPNEVVILDESGEGASAPFEDVATTGIAEALSDAAEGDFLVATGAGEVQRASVDPAAVRGVIGAAASGGTPWGSTISDDPGDGTGWTTTPASGVTVSRAGSVLTMSAASGVTGYAFVVRDASPLGASSSTWDVAVRLQVTAGVGASPRAMTYVGFWVDASNHSVSILRSDRNCLFYVNAAGAFTNVAEVAGPSSGDLTGGQFWLRNTRTTDGTFVAWWGVGVSGALPTTWRRIGVRTDAALAAALPTTASIVVLTGAYGEGAIGSAWTVDVLAIRTTSAGSL